MSPDPLETAFALLSPDTREALVAALAQIPERDEQLLTDRHLAPDTDAHPPTTPDADHASALTALADALDREAPAADGRRWTPEAAAALLNGVAWADGLLADDVGERLLQEARELVAASDDQILTAIGEAAAEGLGAHAASGPPPAQRARRWLYNHMDDLARVICDAPSVQRAMRARDPALLAVVVSEAIDRSYQRFGAPSLPVAAWLVRLGIDTLCSPGSQPGSPPGPPAPPQVYGGARTEQDPHPTDSYAEPGSAPPHGTTPDPPYEAGTASRPNPPRRPKL